MYSFFVEVYNYLASQKFNKVYAFFLIKSKNKVKYIECDEGMDAL